MASFFPNTGRRAQPPGCPPLIAMDFFAILLVFFMLMITPSEQLGLIGPQYAAQFEVSKMNYLDVPYWMDRVSDATRAYSIVYHPVSPEQLLWKRPNPWINMFLRGRLIPGSGGYHEDIVLAIRPDNKYCLGYYSFRNARWHAFEGEEGFFPNPIVLGFNSSYRSLVGGWRGLQYLAVGEKVAEQAISVLYWTDINKTNRNVVKKPIAELLFMFVESHRFYPIRNFVAQNWNGPYLLLIPLHLAELVVNWSDISCALSYWYHTGDWSSGLDAQKLAQSTTIQVRNPAEALALIYPILQGKRCLSYPPK